MKHRKNLWNTVAVLIVAVLVIMAFTRGEVQFWLYVAAFTAWGIWASIKHLIPYLKECHYRNEVKREEKRLKAEQRAPETPVNDEVASVLLRHVNYRITGFLKASYPEATWVWCEACPEKIITNGGTGRIQVFGIQDYNFGEVTFDRKANMTCSLLKVVSLNEEADNPDADKDKPKPPIPPQNTVDPQVWFEQQGRDILENLISNLNTYGHRSLMIRENGDVTVMQADKQITKRYFTSVPEKMYWNRLVKVFESAGLAGEVKEDGIVVSW